jgi:hypothetical protein
MSAIITDDFRRNQARLLVNDIKASAHSNLDSPNALDSPSIVPAWPYRENNNYAIGFGKSDPWPNDASGATEDNTAFAVQAPQGTQQENDDIVRNLFTLKEIAIGGVAQLISANPWTNNRKYKAYDPTDNDAFYKTGDEYPCYVTYGDNVYLCLSNTAVSSGAVPTTSTVAPTGTEYGIESRDTGYVWAHVAKVPTSGTISKLKTGQFTPILNDIDLTSVITSTQQNHTGGLLSYIGVTDGGSGYAAATTTVELTLVGDSDSSGEGTQITPPTGVTAVPIIDSGVVTRIELQGTGGSSHTGSYSYWNTTGNYVKNIRSATVKITDTASGSGAKAFARIAPHNGYGKNAISILPTWFVGITTDFENTEGGDAPALSFRQVSLIKDFKRFSDDSSVDTYDALKFITVTGAVTAPLGNLVPGDIIKQAVAGGKTALMYFDYYDSDKIYYHQNSNDVVNTLDPIVGAADILVKTSAAEVEGVLLAAAVSAVSQGEYRHLDSPPNNTATSAVENTGMEEFNGEVIFHENRRPFSRGTSQTEEVKLIIQL